MDDEPGLADLQRWMVGLVSDAPGEVVFEVDRVVAPSATLTPGERLDLYRQSYRIRLLESLRDMHPALRHLLGPELFDAFALDYLAARPPTSYTLFRLDEGFAAHLEATRPDRDSLATGREAWPDLLIDVVRFERAFLEVYDGPGVEGETLVSSRDVPGETLPPPAVTVEPVPCLRLLRSRYPVGDYVRAVRRGEQPPLPDPRPTHLALVRRDYSVELLRLTAPSYAALEALLGGVDSTEAARASNSTPGAVLGWIAVLADQGLFRRVFVLEPLRKGIRCS
jgi:hypothetical protein